jgi:hypothetical protein
MARLGGRGEDVVVLQTAACAGRPMTDIALAIALIVLFFIGLSLLGALFRALFRALDRALDRWPYRKRKGLAYEQRRRRRRRSYSDHSAIEMVFGLALGFMVSLAAWHLVLILL